jgi:hypothetical protein
MLFDCIEHLGLVPRRTKSVGYAVLNGEIRPAAGRIMGLRRACSAETAAPIERSIPATVGDAHWHEPSCIIDRGKHAERCGRPQQPRGPGGNPLADISQEEIDTHP